MDIKTKELCKRQIEGLAEVFIQKDGIDLSVFVLEMCASLMGAVNNNTPPAGLNQKEIDELIHNYNMIYHVMNSFVREAGKRVPLEEMQADLEKMLSDYQKRFSDLEQAKQSLNENAKRLEEINARINGIYAENGGVIKDYERAAEKAERLEKLKEEYSADKLKELEMQCARLSDETDALRERKDIINHRTAECLDEISTILENMRTQLSDEKDRIESVRSTANEFRTSMRTITEVYAGYQSWFNVLKTPADRLEEEIGREEAQALKEILDERTLHKKNEIMSRIKKDLDSLSKLVSACSRAYQQDQKNTVKRAGK